MIGGRFVLDVVAEHGCCTLAWRARDERDGSEVVLEERRSDDPAAAQQALARMEGIGHSGLTAVTAVVPTDAGAIVAREPVTGETVAAVLARHGTLASEEVTALAWATAEALAALHRAGLAHGGVAADRVLWLADPRVVLALPPPHRWQGPLAEHAAHPGAGALARLSPEQVAGAEPTPASDVFAWGALVIELASGAAPFAEDGGSAATTARRVVRARPDGIEAIADPLLRNTIAHALAKEPSRRPPDGAAVCALLGSARPARAPDRRALGVPDAPSQPAPLRPAAARRRSRWLVAASALAGLAAAVALVALLGSGRPAPPVELVRLPSPAQATGPADDLASGRDYGLVEVVAPSCATIRSAPDGADRDCVPEGVILPFLDREGGWVRVAGPDGEEAGWVAEGDVREWAGER